MQGMPYELESICFAILRQLVEACMKHAEQSCSERETILVSNVQNAVRCVCYSNLFPSLSLEDMNQAKQWLQDLTYAYRAMQQVRTWSLLSSSLRHAVAVC